MTWKQERDLLIAQTMAFVQSVAGKTANAGRLHETPLPSVSPVYPPTIEQRPSDVLPARLTPISHGDLREEIHRRVAAFRARQQAFDRERHQYCDSVMAKVRAGSEKAAKASDNPALKR
ncbi:MAG: hypothetical protein KGJ00_23350 [Bradyrhizobium sp.]|uniref:hypothetical protein n=1 Tax=Bradyrhizobium sp. TaxID=376 RepID=UPI002392CF29|nr:hypothetical protein [Bradyrhizobium sp.]MDE2065352.1 hypothetical protein [Bradyrhizobium sp.]